jgi:hypothetical protein
MITLTTTGIDTVTQALHDYQLDQQNRIRLACIEIAHYLEQYAITNHLWKVRTQATNVTTKGTFDEVGEDLYAVVLSAGMDYDVFLELIKNGKYAWLWPAMVENEKVILDTFARHMRH